MTSHTPIAHHEHDDKNAAYRRDRNAWRTDKTHPRTQEQEGEEEEEEEEDSGRHRRCCQVQLYSNPSARCLLIHNENYILACQVSGHKTNFNGVTCFLAAIHGGALAHK